MPQLLRRFNAAVTASPKLTSKHFILDRKSFNIGGRILFRPYFQSVHHRRHHGHTVSRTELKQRLESALIELNSYIYVGTGRVDYRTCKVYYNIAFDDAGRSIIRYTYLNRSASGREDHEKYPFNAMRNIVWRPELERLWTTAGNKYYARLQLGERRKQELKD